MLPVSFFERANNAYFNSLAMIDADGRVLGLYRKSHIPDGPGYQEKYYFNPGDTGFRVWQTRAGMLGVGICWDQWFPEAARVMVLMGAELLLYPTAIGSEPQAPGYDSCAPLAARDAGPCRRQHGAGGRLEPGRHRAGRQLRARPSTAARSSPTARGEIVEQAPRERRGGADRRRSTSTRWPQPAPPGACSATAGPTSTCRS